MQLGTWLLTLPVVFFIEGISLCVLAFSLLEEPTVRHTQYLQEPRHLRMHGSEVLAQATSQHS